MLKIKDNVDLKELKKYGFKPLYDEETGTVKSYVHQSAISDIERILLIFDKKNTKNKKLIFRKIIKDQFVLNEMCYFTHNSYEPARYCDFDALYDLIQAGLVEKVGK